MIHLIHGPDRLLARQAVQRVASALDPDGHNTSWLDARETPLERLIAAVGTVSFFGAGPVVIVSDFLGRFSRETSPNETGPDDDRQPRRDQPGLAALVNAVPEAHALILFEPSLSAIPAAFKTAAPGATIVACEPPRGAGLVAWMIETAGQSGSSIDRRAAQFLAESLYPQTWNRKPTNPRFDRPPDLALLSQELERLALDAYPGAITSELVAATTPGGPDQRVFRFLDAVLGGDLRAAVAELERLEAAGEDPGMLLAQLLGQVELATIVRATGGADAAAIARDLGSIVPSRIAAVASATRRQHDQPGAAVELSVATDRRLKSGRIRRPDVALRDLVLALTTMA